MLTPAVSLTDKIATPRATFANYTKVANITGQTFSGYGSFKEMTFDGIGTMWILASKQFTSFEVFSFDLETGTLRNRTGELNNNLNLKPIVDRAPDVIIKYLNWDMPGRLAAVIEYGSNTPYSITGFTFDTKTMTFSTPTDYLGDQGSLGAVMVSGPGKVYSVEAGIVKSFTMSDGNWTRLSETGTKHQAAQFHAAALSGDSDLYVFGGRTGAGAVLSSNTFGLFNLTTLAWSYPTTTGTAPSNRELSSMCSLSNQRLFVFGGRNGATYFNDAFVYHEASKSWSATSNGTPPQRLLAPVIACIGSKAYIWGGTPAGLDVANKTTTDVFIFDADTSTWSSVAANGGPGAFQGGAATAFGSKLYITSAVPASGSTYTTVSSFDTTTNQWASVTTNGIGFSLAQGNYTVNGFVRLQAASDGVNWFLGYQEGNVANIRLFTVKPRTVPLTDTVQQTGFVLQTAGVGDVFTIPAGTFNMPSIDFKGKTAVLQGAGRTQTILDFQGNPGLKMINSESHDAKVTKMTIRNARATEGAGLQMIGASATVEDIKFVNCTSSADGGALSIRNGSPTLKNVEFQNVHSSNGNGGAIYSNGATVTMNTIDVQDASSAIAGGGIYLFRATTTATAIKITRATSGDGGGLYAEEGSLTATDAQVSYCKASKNGGGVSGVDGTLALTSFQLMWNNATGSGGGISVSAGTTTSTSTLTHVDIANNRATFGGGFDASLKAQYTLTNVTIDHNMASGTGGGAQLGDRSQITMKSCNIRSNAAVTSGGGIYLTDGASLTTDTAASIGNRRNDVSNNKAVSGAGIATQGTGSITMSKVDIKSNTATQNGAGVSIQHVDASTSNLNNLVIQSNVAQQGNGGGMIIGAVDKVQLSSNQFTSNSAGANGGAIYLTDPYAASKYTLTGLQFTNNAASKDGGALFFARDQPLWQCSSCSFSGNTATLYGGDNATVAYSLQPMQYTSVPQNSTLPLNPAPQVSVADVYGRTVSSDSSTVITVEAVSTDIVLSGPTSTVAVSGVATFTGLIISAPAAGSYQIRYTSSAVGQPSASVNVSIAACRMGSRRLNSACTPCTPGTYGPGIDLNSCTDCEQGKFSALPGAITCTPCAAGQATVSTRQVECSNCVAGKYAGSTGTINCADCPAGSFSGDGSIACTSCADGKFTVGGGQASCQSCGAGTFYDPLVNAQGCISCPADAVVVNKTCQCDVEFYGEYDSSGKLTKCTKCPTGAVCKKVGLRLETIGTQAGFWRSSAASAKFDKCLAAEVCTGSASGASATCLAGHTGPLCDQCIPGYGKSGVVCEQCPDPAAVAFAMLGIFAAMIAVIAFLIRSTMKANERIAEGDVVLTTPMMKLLMNYMQLTSFCQSFDLKWPPVVLAMFSIFQNVSAPKLQISSLDCMFGINVGVFYSKFILFMFVPVIVTVLPTLLFVIRYTMKKATGNVSWEKTRDNIYVTVMVVLFIVHPSVTQRIFEMFSCVSIDNGAKSVLASDVSIDCTSPEHAGWSVIAGIFLVIYTIGIPLAGGVLLFKNRALVKAGDSHMLTKFGFLYNGFERESIKFYWEVAPLMIRKVVVLMIVVFLQTFGTLVQALAGVFVIFFALLLHIRYQPYESDILDNLESMSLVTSFTTLYFGLFFFVSDISVDWQGVLSFVIMATNIVTFIAIVLFFLHYNAVLYATKIINKIRSWRNYQPLEAVKRGGKKE
eukprot:TRINITY_DN1040_c1_g1_i8.p1 TRINITY_DN1040_c1_g1~~TRINITY_DN1040_c1_g1_i8.p1  ORF type:complete len:1696 (+),score=495.31 TRINITY_DN1040_c1_g1_i8:38-5125(+)